ncbi:hypothetical protein GH714_034991 [Hevea brasiliensis]|uniref:beta-galactosidase n=1 Tax=Hevea brasiliensis TaxID=3981 RepID=A0A6A6NKE2_HEVBR|nr:hypothetical protein GH714_034991 [Hevea brasiliensis]
MYYNFEGRYDVLRFIKLIQKSSLYAHLRIGPYVRADWNFGRNANYESAKARSKVNDKENEEEDEDEDDE